MKDRKRVWRIPETLNAIFLDLRSITRLNFTRHLMFVDSLVSDDPLHSVEGELTWNRVRKAIEGLDGKGISEVSIAKRGTESHMSISGGGFYLVSATLDNDIFYDLVDPSGDPATIVLVVSGGQPVTVGMNECVDLESALQVAKRFAEGGIIDSDKRWCRNPPE